MKVIPASEFENYLGQETGVTDWIEITQERINQLQMQQMIINLYMLIQKWRKQHLGEQL